MNNAILEETELQQTRNSTDCDEYRLEQELLPSYISRLQSCLHLPGSNPHLTECDFIHSKHTQDCSTHHLRVNKLLECELKNCPPTNQGP